jgi:hypothetical protein
VLNRFVGRLRAGDQAEASERVSVEIRRLNKVYENQIELLRQNLDEDVRKTIENEDAGDISFKTVLSIQLLKTLNRISVSLNSIDEKLFANSNNDIGNGGQG